MIKLKPASLTDSKFWWIIRNEKTVREASFDPKPIPYSFHKKWFEEKLKDKNCNLFIIWAKNKKVGQLRLQKENGNVEISLSLSPSYRGKGYGKEAIKIGAKFAKDKMKAKKTIAYTRLENPASIFSFEKAGFKNIGEVSYKNKKAILLEKSSF